VVLVRPEGVGQVLFVGVGETTNFVSLDSLVLDAADLRIALIDRSLRLSILRDISELSVIFYVYSAIGP
jgi:hypothetical protein